VGVRVGILVGRVAHRTTCTVGIYLGVPVGIVVYVLQCQQIINEINFLSTQVCNEG
jgi:hypothetical protein